MATFDATKGGAASNSYATTNEFDAYFSLEYDSAELLGLSAAVKQQLLVTATRQIDAISTLFYKAASTQALNFPVDPAGELDIYGDALGDGFTEAKQATILQAAYIYQNNDAIKEAKSNAITGVRYETLGKIAKEMTGPNPFAKFAPGVLSMLAPFIDLEFKTSRG